MDVVVFLGASLAYHGTQASRGLGTEAPPALVLLDLYRKFGVKFDHIYAYEMKPHESMEVFEQLPDHYQAAYHWINVGVSSHNESKHNPLKMLKQNYEEDDMVIVKLDVDTPELERELAEQVKNDPELAKLIDHFYFEHHVFQKELQAFWGRGEGIVETVAESMELFTQLREHGVPAHFWV
jgi:hypothetical protein